jgi:hypothetical protein
VNITLIGMSNLGKTHWANRLAAECGFRRIDCDALVEAALAPHLKSKGFSGVQDVAKWMGQPFDQQYSVTSQEFVRCEREVMRDVIGLLREAHGKDGPPLAIDTCGSVIYAGDDIKQSLRELTQVVYLEASEQHRVQLFERYMAEPKPVIWGSAFNRDDGEDSRQALARCYPALLSSRARFYEDWAHVSVPFEVHRAADASPVSVFSGLRLGTSEPLSVANDGGTIQRGIQRS